MVPYIEVSLDELPININKPLAFDTETIGLYGRIRLAQFYQEGWDAVHLVNNPNPFELAALLSNVEFIAHNAHYDITTIQANTTSRWIPSKFEDTLYLARLKFYKEEAFSLDKVMEYVLQRDVYAEQGIDKKVWQDSDWSAMVLCNQQKTYAATDVYYLLDVYNAVKDYADNTSYRLDKLFIQYALDFQNNGMPVIAEAVQKQYADNLKAIEEIGVKINVNSYQQVRPYIGSTMSDDLGLAKLALQGNVKADNVRKARKLIKQNSFLNKFDVDSGYIYGKFTPSARSGRSTCKDQNLQQLPRKLKHIFGYELDGDKVFIYSDYKQLELRTICAITGELRMAKLLRDNEDVHDFTAKMLFGENFTPEQRQIAKTANFGLLYGAGVDTFLSILIKLANLMLAETAGVAIKKRWLNLWPSIKAWQDSGMQAWRRKEAWQTPFGRKYIAKLATDQLNIMNQGFGAEVAKLAMHYMFIDPEFADTGLKLNNYIHDSYIFTCANDEQLYKPAADLIARSMQKAWFEALAVGKDLKIRDLPMPVDVFVGFNWGSIEKEPLYKLELEGMKYYVHS